MIDVDTDVDFTLAPEKTDALVGPFTVLVSVTGQAGRFFAYHGG